ncbi:uncharacterized protein LOC144578501 [Callithrix jacchus]
MGAERAGTETETQTRTQPAHPRTARGENSLLAPSLECRWAQEAGTTLTKAESSVGDFLPRTVTLSPCNRFPLKTLRKGPCPLPSLSIGPGLDEARSSNGV